MTKSQSLSLPVFQMSAGAAFPKFRNRSSLSRKRLQTRVNCSMDKPTRQTVIDRGNKKPCRATAASDGERFVKGPRPETAPLANKTAQSPTEREAPTIPKRRAAQNKNSMGA